MGDRYTEPSRWNQKRKAKEKSVLIVTAYFEDLDMDILTRENSDPIRVIIDGVPYLPDIISTISSD